MSAEAPPLPLVKLTRHPLKWAANKIKLTIAAVVLAHIGTLIVVALYYLLFETWAPITHLWHDTVADNGTRHMLRNVYEGVLGGTLAQFVVFNHFAKRRTKLGWLDRLEIRLGVPNLKDDRELSGWQLALSPLMVLVYAIPGFLLGAGAVWAIKHGVTTAHKSATLIGEPNAGRSAWQHFQTLWTANRDQKIVGLFASVFMGRRPVRAVAEDLQGYFVARRVARGKPTRRYHPPNFQARMNAASVQGATGRIDRTGAWVAYLLTAAILIGLSLAGFGAWVLAYKA